jgi:hypothetical protein
MGRLGGALSLITTLYFIVFGPLLQNLTFSHVLGLAIKIVVFPKNS